MDSTHLFSVIIPTRNHAQLVADLLNSLALQVAVDYRWEVLVIDNGSTDTTAEKVNALRTRLDIEVRYINEPNPGLHNGRHRGAREARGKYLAYLDDDVLVTTTWLSGIKPLVTDQADAVVGRILPKWESPPPPWLVKLTQEPGYLSLLDLGTSGCYVNPKYVYGDNFFIPTRLIFDLKGFNPDSLPEDLLRYRGDGEYGFMLKFKQAGLRAWYEPGATAFHRIPANRMNLDYLCKRSYAQGISDSFSQTRAEQLDRSLLSDDFYLAITKPQKDARYYRNRLTHLTLSGVWGNLKNRVLRLLPFTQSNIKAKLRQAWWAGYQYHQREVKTDPKLLSWVLRNDYWDVKPD